MTNMMKPMTSSEFSSKLNSGVYDITFTKLDGAIRNMIATRSPELIPDDHNYADDAPVVIDDAVSTVAVFDLQICGWRSVRPVSLTEFKPASPEVIQSIFTKA